MHAGIVAWSLFENKGGIERLACALAGAMIDRSHRVTLFYKRPAQKGAQAVFPVPAGVQLVPLDLDYADSNFGAAREALCSAGLDALAALFSWESLLWFPPLLRGTGVPLIISEHNTPALINGKWNEYERLCCLHTADELHILLQGFVREYPESLVKHLRVIPNPAKRPPWRADAARAAGSRRTLLSAGRFVDKVKQFSLLIKAFALLHARFPDWDLELCGDGESMGGYRDLAASLLPAGRVRFPGMVDDMDGYYAAADLFCVPSLYEGFGMVTVEAQGHGLPAIGFAACPGTNEIIVHGENGLLAEHMTPESLAVELEKLMEDDGLRAGMGRRAWEMLDRYAPEAVFDAWETLFLDAAARKGRTRIDELAAMDTAGDGNCASGELHGDNSFTACARELVLRGHPFDRSAYLSLHRELQARGEASPFSEKHINGFIKRHKRYLLAGHDGLWPRFRQFFRNFRGR
ncbi:glycosyltransferase [Desulfovibrio sp. OttesenSCG-928-G15]|nr:glycosyltransferase [Desulfovibrio sp. OttesenSCG-928-G15]